MFSPKMQTIIEIIKDEIENQRLVVFIGAGCSVDAGLPSWSSLLKNICNKFKICCCEENPLKLADEIEKVLGKVKFREEICKNIKPHPNTESNLQNNIARLPVNLFITSNYDGLFEKSLDKLGEKDVIRLDGDLVSIRPKIKTLVKIHGDKDSPTTLIITEEDYRKYSSNHKPFWDYLKHICTGKTLLMIGVSFDDPNLQRVNDYILDLFGDFIRNPYLFIKKPKAPKENSEKDNEKYQKELSLFEEKCKSLKERGIHLIVIDEYDEILDVINEIVTSIVTDEQKIKGFVDKQARELIDSLRENSVLPTKEEAWSRAEKLNQFITKEETLLPQEVCLEAYLTIANCALRFQEISYSKKAENYLKRALDLQKVVKDPIQWNEKISQVKAKLLFEQKKNEEALKEVEGSGDPETQLVWLGLLIDTNNLDLAEKFLDETKLDVHWSFLVPMIYVKLGNFQKAENAYIESLKLLKGKAKLLDSLDGNYASALLERTYDYFGKTRENFLVLNTQIDEEQKEQLNRIILLTKNIEERNNSNNTNHHWFEVGLKIKLTAYRLMGNFQEVKANSMKLISNGVFDNFIVEHLITLLHTLDEVELVKFNNKLKEHPNNIVMCSARYAIILFDKDKEYEDTFKKIIAEAINAEGSLTQKENFVNMIFHSPFFFEDTEFLIDSIGKILPENNIFRKLIEAEYSIISKDIDKAEKIINNITKLEGLPPSLKAEVKNLQGRIDFIKNKDNEQYRKCLEESLDIYPNPIVKIDLIRILAELRDYSELYKHCCEFEKWGFDDEDTLFISAQTFHYSNDIDKAINSWKKLLMKDSLNPAYYIGYSKTLWKNRQEDQALGLLQKNREKLGNVVEAILLESSYLVSMKRMQEAFELLFDKKDNDKFIENPYYLMNLMNVAFKAGHEEKIGFVFRKVKKMMDENDLPDDINFREVNIDEFKKIASEVYATNEKLNNSYLKGETSLYQLIFYNNKSCYLDWAERTQDIYNIPLTNEEEELKIFCSNFNLYCSDVVCPKKDLNKLTYEEISLDESATEITIDYISLITIHRLGLLNKIINAFDHIYIPSAYFDLWKEEKLQYPYHQTSMLYSWKNILKEIDLNKILVIDNPITSPQNIHSSGIKNINELNIARANRYLYVNDFIEQNELSEYQDVVVSRLSQLLDWLFKKGKISSNQFKEIGSSYKSKDNLSEDISEKLKENRAIIIELSTLQLLIQYNLYVPLGKAGVTLYISSQTAKVVRTNIREISFRNQVEGWHIDLIDRIDSLKKNYPQKFIEAKTPIEIIKDQYEHKAFFYSVLPIKIASEKQTVLITDDRFIFKISETMRDGINSNVFAMLKLLRKRAIISEEEFAEKLLLLCKWRYKFLIPDAETLFYFALQYKENLPGESLEAISRYLFHCMQDPGLDMNIVITQDNINSKYPLPAGMRIWNKWTATLIEFLIKVWVSDEFSLEQKESLLKFIFNYFMPAPPSSLQKEKKEIVQKKIFDYLLDQILIIAPSSIEVLENLHLLVEYIKEMYYVCGRDPQIPLIRVLISINEIDYISQKEKQLFTSKILSLYFGKDKITFNGKGLFYAAEVGFINFEENSLEIPEPSSLFSEKELDELLKTGIYENKIYLLEKSGPLIRVLVKENNENKLIIPHIYFESPFQIERKAVYRLLMQSDDIEKYCLDTTREKMILNSESLFSSDPNIWKPVAFEIKELLLTDFLYTNSMLNELYMWNHNTEMNRIIYFLIGQNLQPDLEILCEDKPCLLKNSSDSKSLVEQFHMHIENNELTDIEEILDYYISVIGFAPLGTPLSILDFFEDLILSNDLYQITLSIIEWVKNKEVLLEKISGLTLLFYIRLQDNDECNKVIDSEEVTKSIQEIITAILCFHKKRYDEKIINCITHLYLLLNEYYSYYMYLNSKDIATDETSSILPLWLSSKVLNTFLHGLQYYESNNKLSAIKKLIEGIENELIENNHKHIASNGFNYMSSIKYQSIFSQNYLSNYLFSELSSLINLDQNKILEKSIFSSRVFNEHIVGLILESGLLAIVSGEMFLTPETIQEATIQITKSRIDSMIQLLSVVDSEIINSLTDEQVEKYKLIKGASIDNFMSQMIDGILEEQKNRKTFMLIALKNLEYKVWMNNFDIEEINTVYDKLFDLKEEEQLELVAIVSRLTQALYWRDNRSEYHKLMNWLTNIDYPDDENLIQEMLYLYYNTIDKRIINHLSNLSRKLTGINQKLRIFKSYLKNILESIEIEYKEYIKALIYGMDMVDDIEE